MRTTPKIIVVQSIGQIGNRLEQFSHLIAFAKDHRCEIMHLAFWVYADPFKGTAHDLFLRWPAKPSDWVRKELQRLTYLAFRGAYQLGMLRWVPLAVIVHHPWDGGAFDLGSPDFVALTKSKKWIFLVGAWKHRYWENYEAHIELTREHFALIPEIDQRVKSHFAPIRQAGDIIVGMHIRQGDNFTDPVRRDAFTTDEYLKVMRQIPALFPGKKVVFLVCSNLKQGDEIFGDLTVFRGPGDFIEDMYSLAECDYICGAGQSSFSGWASLMGEKPRYGLFDPDKTVTLDDFVVCKGLED